MRFIKANDIQIALLWSWHSTFAGQRQADFPRVRQLVRETNAHFEAR